MRMMHPGGLWMTIGEKQGEIDMKCFKFFAGKVAANVIACLAKLNALVVYGQGHDPKHILLYPLLLILLSMISSSAIDAAVNVHGTVINAWRNPVPGATVFFISPAGQDTTIAVTDDDGVFSVMLEATQVSVDEEARPETFMLHQNYPNPFNPTTTVSFDLPRAAHVNLTIFNILGQSVARLYEGRLAQGSHAMTWNGRDDTGRALAAGIYFYRLKSGTYADTRRMLLVDGGGTSRGSVPVSSTRKMVSLRTEKPAADEYGAGYTVIVRKDRYIPLLKYDVIVPGDSPDYETTFYMGGYDERYSHELFYRGIFYIAQSYHDEHRHDFYMGFSESGFSGDPDHNFIAYCQDDTFTKQFKDDGIIMDLGICSIENDTLTITIMETPIPGRVNHTYQSRFYCFGANGPYLFDNARELTFGYVDSTTVKLYQ